MKHLLQNVKIIKRKAQRSDALCLKTVSVILLTSLLLLTLTGCGNNFGRLYPEKETEKKNKPPLSERIAKWENFRLPGLRDEEEEESDTLLIAPDGTVLTEEEAAALAAEEQAAAERQAVRYSETMDTIVGEWSELSEALPLFRPIVSWFGSLKIEDDGTYSSGTGAGTWELSPDCSQLTLRGSRGKTVVDILHDGDYAKLCAPDLHLNFLRSSELNDYIAERFVAVELTAGNVDQYISRPKNVGIIPDEKDQPTNESAWVLSSPAYAEGLVYYGRSEDFSISIQNNAGENRVAILPYDTLPLANGASFGRITQAHGTLVFIRTEYVTDNRMTDARTRTLTLSDGTTHTTSMTWYPDLADYSEWIF